MHVAFPFSCISLIKTSEGIYLPHAVTVLLNADQKILGLSPRSHFQVIGTKKPNTYLGSIKAGSFNFP